MDKPPKKRIFVVDDQEEVLSLLKDYLTGAGFEVVVCKEPKDVLTSINSFKPDLILLDLLMPELGGFEVCEILNNDPQTQGIPIIIISGLGDSVDIKKACKLGVVGYLVKPFSLAALSKEISKALANKEKVF
ncbi:MAG: response regulator [Candidatus Omnitrophica bacterium]|nr:response regulator [Candidatus Omnitrophota bacterium]